MTNCDVCVRTRHSTMTRHRLEILRNLVLEQWQPILQEEVPYLPAEPGFHSLSLPLSSTSLPDLLAKIKWCISRHQRSLHFPENGGKAESTLESAEAGGSVHPSSGKVSNPSACVVQGLNCTGITLHCIGELSYLGRALLMSESQTAVKGGDLLGLKIDTWTQATARAAGTRLLPMNGCLIHDPSWPTY